MKLFYNALAVGLLLAGFGCVAYGVLVGFGGGINQRILATQSIGGLFRWHWAPPLSPSFSSGLRSAWTIRPAKSGRFELLGLRRQSEIFA